MSVNNLDNILWTEKYRPKNLAELIVPQRIKKIFDGGVVQSMLLHGTAGIGKTSAAKAICKQFNHNVLYLNCSDTNGVDTIRDTIIDFAMNQSAISYENPIKVVIMDEMDGLSQQAFNALRATMERCAVEIVYFLVVVYKSSKLLNVYPCSFAILIICSRALALSSETAWSKIIAPL